VELKVETITLETLRRLCGEERWAAAELCNHLAGLFIALDRNRQSQGLPPVDRIVIDAESFIRKD
jgi:hypothetical protein